MHHKLRVQAGSIETGMWSNLDWFPTLLAAAGVPDVKEQLLQGYKAGDTTFKVHLDGYNQLDNLLGKAPSQREEFFYFSDQGTLNAVRWKDWKLHFTIMEDWIGGKTSKGWPKVVNLKSDPFERAVDESFMYTRWYADKFWLFVPVQQQVGTFVASFKDYPARQTSASFNLDPIMQVLSRGASAGGGN